MNRCSLLTVAGLAALAGSIAIAQPAKETRPAQPGAKPAAQPEAPPGMSEADMKACAEAGTPGPQHEHLAKAVGVWSGKCKMWASPGTEPELSECAATFSSLMDGRFTKCEIEGEMPGMGPFHGVGIYGFDNVAQKFQSTWINSCGTGIMTGTGELSPDGKTLTWKFTYNCPITKKPAVLREIERRTGNDTMTLEVFGAEPHSGKEFKMMEIAYTRQPGAAPAKPAGTR